MTFVLHWRRDEGPPLATLEHRLSDGLTRLRDEPVTTWSRGALTVLAFEHSPSLSISESPAGFVAVLFGRLDDFANLVARLGGSTVLGTDPTDADLLAAAYQRWGDECFEHLLGDFAAAIWEGGRRSLLCARDVVGIAPLYYWSSPHEVVLAGHLGGVVTHPLVRREPNEGYIAEILSDDIHSRHETLYRDVWRLVAGHAARFDETTSPRIWEWGRIDPVEMSQNLRSEEYDERYKDLLSRAVADRMRGPAKVGVELSGGLDSSNVAVATAPLAAQRYGEPLRSYSLTFPGLPSDETEYIQAVAASADILPTLIPCPPPDAAHLDDDVQRSWDLPETPNASPWRLLYSSALADGVEALLSGQGGDQWFSVSGGYLADLLRRGRVAEALALTRYIWPGEPATAVLTRKVVSRLLRTLTPQPRRTSRFQQPAWITASLAQRADLTERLSTDPSSATPSHARADGIRSGWEAFVHDGHGLAAGRVGLVYRHPFYDARVAAFAFGLPESQRWEAGQDRRIQRRAMASAFPSSVWSRQTKADFSDLFVEEFQTAGGRQRFAQLRIGIELDWVDSSEVLRHFDELVAAVESGRPPPHIWPLWFVLAVDSWFRGCGQ